MSQDNPTEPLSPAEAHAKDHLTSLIERLKEVDQRGLDDEEKIKRIQRIRTFVERHDFLYPQAIKGFIRLMKNAQKIGYWGYADEYADDVAAFARKNPAAAPLGMTALISFMRASQKREFFGYMNYRVQDIRDLAAKQPGAVHQVLQDKGIGITVVTPDKNGDGFQYRFGVITQQKREPVYAAGCRVNWLSLLFLEHGVGRGAVREMAYADRLVALRALAPRVPAVATDLEALENYDLRGSERLKDIFALANEMDPSRIMDITHRTIHVGTHRVASGAAAAPALTKDV